MAMNSGLAKYLADKKAGTLNRTPSAANPVVGGSNVSLMGKAPHGKRHSKVKINPHK